MAVIDRGEQPTDRARATDEATDEAIELRGRATKTAEVVVLLVGGAIAMGETERLMTGALTSYGSSRSVTDVVGLAAFGGGDAWRVWLDLPDRLRRSVAGWLLWHALFDIALYLGYFLLLRRLASRVAQASVALWLLLGFEVVETVLLWRGSVLLASDRVPDLFPGVLAVVASLKWVTAAVLALVIVISDELRGAVARGALRLLRAAWEQRLSLVVVTVLGVLSLVSGPHMWDQLPDVERSWLDGDPEDVWHGVWAAVFTVVVALYLFVVGRLRSERVWAARVHNARADQHQERPVAEHEARAAEPRRRWKGPGWLKPRFWWWWLLPPAVLVATGGLLEALPLDGLVDWRNVILAAAVPVFVLLLSGAVLLYYRLLRRLGIHRSLWEASPPVGNGGQRRRTLDVWVAGDVLAVSVVVIGGLGLVRSLVAPVLLGAAGGSGIWLPRLVVLLAGAAVALSAFPLAAVLLGKLDKQELPEEVEEAPVRWLLRPSDNRRTRGRRLRRVLALGLWFVAIAALVALMVWPLQLGRGLGVVATTLVALGAWTAVLGFLIVLLQYREPLPLFRALRMRSTPVLTLLLVAPLVASQAGGDPDLHALSTPPGGPPAAVPDRPSLREAFAEWLGSSQACDRRIDGTDDQDVRPMVLVAASGGGIRAAVWTAGVLDRLGAGGPCASQAVFLSSGISGGSVGLALTRGQDPTGDARELAKPHALAAGVAGTLVGDLIAGGTGLRVPSHSLAGEDGEEPAGRQRWDWRDRAGLMEAAWEVAAPPLTARYDQARSGPAGVLVMNSAAAGQGCRVLVSQVELAADPRATAARAAEPEGSESVRLASCQGQTDQPAASLDLHDLYGPCTPDMSWATAAMLSARFPWILPGGRVPPVRRALPAATIDCSGRPSLQLIDGGYADGAGIGTLSDVAPALVQVLREHNATLSAGEPYVIPVVLYLEDETRKDIVRQPEGLSPELFVPLAGRNAGTVQMSSGTWLQRVADSIADPCTPADQQRCRDAVRAVQGRLSGGIVIAAPLTKPSVEAPLGWTLSEDSHRQLEQAVEAQTTRCLDELRPGGYPCLRQLLDVLQPVPA